jgi:hypothetical protein
MHVADLISGVSSPKSKRLSSPGWTVGDQRQPQDPLPRRKTVALNHEWASLRPFGAADQKTAFTPERVAIEKPDSRVVSERLNPRESFAGHKFATAWDLLRRAYFNGYAM